MTDSRSNRGPGGIPRPVWALGFVSLFMDFSSEMIHGLLPVFMVSVLGASAMLVGLIEGVSEAATFLVKAFSGAISDKIRRRKPLAVIGYGLAVLSKPLFAVAGSIGTVFTARLLDRVGKGIRGAPRDALVADVIDRDIHGAAFGLRQSLDTVGAILGPTVAIGLMLLTAGDFRLVFWVAVIPAVISVTILVFAVREPAVPQEGEPPPKIRATDIRNLGSFYWLVVAIGAVFTMARFSEAFIMLRAGDVGLSAALIPVMLLVLSAVFALTSYPAGYLSDRIGRKALLVSGILVLIIADLTLAFAGNVWHVLAGSALWGLHLGLTQGIFSALVADTAKPRLKATAFGIFSLVSGIGALIASVLAGWLWDHYGASVTFFAGAGFATVATIGFLALRWPET